MQCNVLYNYFKRNQSSFRKYAKQRCTIFLLSLFFLALPLFPSSPSRSFLSLPLFSFLPALFFFHFSRAFDTPSYSPSPHHRPRQRYLNVLNIINCIITPLATFDHSCTHTLTLLLLLLLLLTLLPTNVLLPPLFLTLFSLCVFLHLAFLQLLVPLLASWNSQFISRILLSLFCSQHTRSIVPHTHTDQCFLPKIILWNPPRFISVTLKQCSVFFFFFKCFVVLVTD